MRGSFYSGSRNTATKYDGNTIDFCASSQKSPTFAPAAKRPCLSKKREDQAKDIETNFDGIMNAIVQCQSEDRELNESLSPIGLDKEVIVETIKSIEGNLDN